MVRCPHCSYEDNFETLTDEEMAQIPPEWKFGQVGPQDQIVRCRKCKKLSAVNPKTETINKVGLSEFELV